MSYSTGIDKPIPARHPNQTTLTDKQVLKAIWAYDLEPSYLRSKTLATACRERGIAITKIDDKAITRLLELCGHRD